jgi:hypothetical protein
MKTCSLLSITIDQMCKGACHARHQRAYEAATACHPSFASHRDIASVLAALQGESEQDGAVRDALTRALLLEHRAGNSQVWTHALFASYYPMLRRLRARVVCSWPAEDVDQVVLAAFADALREVDLESACPCSLMLRQLTARLTFRRLRSERDEQLEVVDGDFQDIEEDLVGIQMADTAVGSSFLEAMLSRAGDCADVLRATVSGEESLRDYVERTVDGDVETRRRAYERLKRQRGRALTKLRKSDCVRAAVPA